MRKTVRAAILGTGRFADRTHLPNLVRLDGVDVVAACDVNPDAVQETAEAFDIPAWYTDGHEMLDREAIDVLYSVIPAFARTDVEATAAERGIHLFSEKPQATRMAVARRIDEAIRKSGVLSTVSFRERYRPIFQEARRLLEGKAIVHARFVQPGGLPKKTSPNERRNWHQQMNKAGGRAFDWGVHAVDYTRFMTGLDFDRAQAFYHHPPEYDSPLSSSFSLRFSTGATMTLSFVASAGSGAYRAPWFTFLTEDGCLEIHRYERIDLNGETVYQAEDFDPWFEQTRVFIEAIRTGDGSGILNDYHDGLFTLAPVLAGWASSRRDGACIDVARFMEA